MLPPNTRFHRIQNTQVLTAAFYRMDKSWQWPIIGKIILDADYYSTQIMTKAILQNTRLDTSRLRIKLILCVVITEHKRFDSSRLQRQKSFLSIVITEHGRLHRNHRVNKDRKYYWCVNARTSFSLRVKRNTDVYRQHCLMYIYISV